MSVGWLVGSARLTEQLESSFSWVWCKDITRSCVLLTPVAAVGDCSRCPRRWTRRWSSTWASCWTSSEPCTPQWTRFGTPLRRGSRPSRGTLKVRGLKWEEWVRRVHYLSWQAPPGWPYLRLSRWSTKKDPWLSSEAPEFHKMSMSRSHKIRLTFNVIVPSLLMSKTRNICFRFSSEERVKSWNLYNLHLETRWTWCKGQSWTHGSRCGRPGSKMLVNTARCSKENSTSKQRFCILVLLLKFHPPLCVCICKGGFLNVCQDGMDEKSQIGERRTFWFVKWQEKKSSHCQIIPPNQKQTNDVKNGNCYKLLLAPIITRPTTLLDSYFWKIIWNIIKNILLWIFVKNIFEYFSKKIFEYFSKKSLNISLKILWIFPDLVSPYWSRTFWIYDAPAFPCPLLRSMILRAPASEAPG